MTAEHLIGSCQERIRVKLTELESIALVVCLVRYSWCVWHYEPGTVSDQFLSASCFIWQGQSQRERHSTYPHSILPRSPPINTGSIPKTTRSTNQLSLLISDNTGNNVGFNGTIRPSVPSI